jgi:hypothetical protein
VGLALVVLVGAVGVGLLLRGSWDRLTALRLRQPLLVLGAVLAQAGGSAVGVLGFGDARRAYVAGLAISAAFAVAFCARNLRVPGVPLVVLGLVSNATVVGLNAAMPVSIVAALHAGVPINAISAGTDPRHTISGLGTAWSWLGDDIPAPLPWRPEVVSPGDVLIAAGLGELVVVGMARRRRDEIGSN